MTGRFDVAGVPVGYFAEAPETAVFESLCRREATALSLQLAAKRALLCVQATQSLTLLDPRVHTTGWPVLQSLRFSQTQELAAEVHAQGMQGIVYRSSQHHAMDCFSLFGDTLSTLKTAWAERLTEPGTGNLHSVLAAALRGSQVPLTP